MLSGAAGWNRARSLVWVVALLAVSRLVWPERLERTQWEYLLTATLGYGHLIGAALPRTPPRFELAVFERGAFIATGALTGLAVYSWLLEHWPPVFLAVLAVSVWHTVENDLALPRAYRSGVGRVGAIPRSPRFHARVLGVWLCLSGLALQTPEWLEFVDFLAIPWALGAGTVALASAAGAGIVLSALGERGFGLGLAAISCALVAAEDALGGAFGLSDVFVAATLHHLISWLGLFFDRVRRLEAQHATDEARELRRRIALVHAVPGAVCAALLVVGAGQPPDSGFAFAVFAPGIYLFWSALHVAHTAFARGWEGTA